MQSLNFKNIKPLVKASKYQELRAEAIRALVEDYQVTDPARLSYIGNKFTELINDYFNEGYYPQSIRYLKFEVTAPGLSLEDYALAKTQYNQITAQILNLIGVKPTKALFSSLSAAISLTYLKNQKLNYQSLAENFKAYRHTTVDHFKTFTQLEHAAKKESQAA